MYPNIILTYRLQPTAIVDKGNVCFLKLYALNYTLNLCINFQF